MKKSTQEISSVFVILETHKINSTMNKHSNEENKTKLISHDIDQIREKLQKTQNFGSIGRS